MDYEKLYKETIDKLRKLHNNWNSTQNRAAKEIELVFPEILDTEDERIKRCIQVALTDVDEKRFNDYDTTIKDCLAWLEKQGEHKCDCKYVGCHVNDVKRWCHKKQAEILYEKCNTKCSEYQKQGERSSWSEEDEKLLNYAISLTDDAQIKNFLKSLKDRVQPQPKQEWSEEDEKIVLSLHHALNCADAQNAVTKTGVEVADVANWLFDCKERFAKSNNWKPSDEQMNCLETLIDCGFYIPSTMSKAPIESLYNDLKKL